MDEEGNNPRPAWHQVNIPVEDRKAGERMATTYLGPGMKNAESAGLVASWFYIRKGDWWRLRYLPATCALAGETTEFIEDLLRAMQAHSQVSSWVKNIYEPETYAFGGPEAMDTAHDLFHRDSRHILDYLARHDATIPRGSADNRNELSILLCAALLRSAGQDWYEQGDVWARVSENRPAGNDIAPAQQSRIVASMRRLMTVDTGPESALINGALEFAADWVGAFEQAGRTLMDLSRTGTLTRGLRAVLTHHIIFHWNRLGLPYTTQRTMAATAREIILGD